MSCAKTDLNYIGGDMRLNNITAQFKTDQQQQVIVINWRTHHKRRHIFYPKRKKYVRVSLTCNVNNLSSN